MFRLVGVLSFNEFSNRHAPILKAHLIGIAITVHLNLHPSRERIDHWSPYPVKTTSRLITTLTEFTAGMEDSKDHFNGWLTWSMQADWQTTTIILNFNTTILTDGYLNMVRKTWQSFIDSIVHNFI